MSTLWRPTRLLDWTTDFLTALFFSCYDNDNIEKEGALFICDRKVYRALKSGNEFAEETKELAFVKTNVSNPRMRSQSGCFMAWGSYPLEKEVSTESYDL